MDIIEYSDNIASKLLKLKNIVAVGNVEHPAVKTEIADLLVDLRANGLSDEVIEGRTGYVVVK